MTRAGLIRELDTLHEWAVSKGLPIEAVEITVDGHPRILTRRPAPGVALNDDTSWVDLAGETQDHGRA